MIQGLIDHSLIGEEIKDRLSLLKDFDLSLIDEARDLARTISESGPSRPGQDTSEDIELRNRICTLISIRIKKIRKAAKYVFRKHPEIIRQFTSDYQRKRRMEAKRKKLANQTVNINEQSERKNN